MRFGLFLFGLAIILAGPVSAQEQQFERYTLDKPHTQILFSIDHMGFSRSYGKFTDYEGAIEFNRAEPEKSKADVIIKTASLDLDDEKWNEHMKSADFFNVEEFPEMTFVSRSIQVTGENTADITGDLTLLGVTKPVVLKTIFRKAGKYPMGNRYAAGFAADTKIKRSDFSMNMGIPMVGDEVDIHIEVEAIREGEAVNQ